MASSRKTLGERQLAIPPEIKIYTPKRDAGGTNDHVGQGLHDHSYLPRLHDHRAILPKPGKK